MSRGDPNHQRSRARTYGERQRGLVERQRHRSVRVGPRRREEPEPDDWQFEDDQPEDEWADA